MNNNDFTIEQKEILEKLRVLFPHLSSVLMAKTTALPTIASLSATVLIVATFNERLISITTGFKWAITVLVAIIPISLLIFYLEIETAANKTKEVIEKMSGIDDLYKEDKKISRKIFDFLFGYCGIFFMIIFSVVIGYFILLLWEII